VFRLLTSQQVNRPRMMTIGIEKMMRAVMALVPGIISCLNSHSLRLATGSYIASSSIAFLISVSTKVALGGIFRFITVKIHRSCTML